MTSNGVPLRLLLALSQQLRRSELFCTFAVLGKLPGARPRVIYLISTSFNMSKQSLFWGNASGKLGETVFYRAGGEQRNRTYVKNIKNPKTLAQAEQRLAMLNFSAGFRLLAPVLRASFPNRPSNLSGFNAFVKANKNILTPVIDRTIADKGLAVLGQMTLSQGNLVVGDGLQLRRDLFTDEEEESAPARDGIGFIVQLDSSRIMEGGDLHQAYLDTFVDLEVAPRVTILSATQASALLQLLGLSQNAVITGIHGSYDDDGYSYETNRITATVNDNGSFMGRLGLTFIPTNDIAPKDYPTEFFLGLNVSQDSVDSDYYSLIISDKVDGKLDVTNARLITSSSNTEYTQQFQKGGDVYEQIMTNYGPSQGSVLEA